MQTWTSLETRFRALVEDSSESLFHVWWGDEHGCAIEGVTDDLKPQFLELCRIAGALLREALDPTSNAARALLPIEDPAERWARFLLEHSGQAWQRSHGTRGKVRVSEGSVKNAAETSANECLRLNINASARTWAERLHARAPTHVTVQRDRPESLRPLLVGLLVIAFVLVVAVLVPYAITFRGAISSQQVDWGLFGDYVGGTLGAAFGLLAFAGVLVTVYLQNKQIATLGRQANIDELQRLLGTLAAHIDERLEQEPIETLRDLTIGDGHPPPVTSVFFLLSAAGTVAVEADSGGTQPAFERIRWNVTQAIRHDVHVLCIELQQLVWCLQEYGNSGGSSSVVAFYKQRYAVIVAWIDALQLLSSARCCFAPKADPGFALNIDPLW